MTPFVLWFVAGIIFLITEIFTETFFLLCLAIGAGAVTISEGFLRSEWEGYFQSSVFLAQILIFAGTSSIFMTFLPKMLKGKKVTTSIDSFIGLEKTVEQRNRNLVVILEGQVWRIENADEFKNGEKVIIKKIVGTKVLLEKKYLEEKNDLRDL
jgi:membrane protein implicated in regulation of membrane protease activity